MQEKKHFQGHLTRRGMGNQGRVWHLEGDGDADDRGLVELNGLPRCSNRDILETGLSSVVA